MTKQTLSIRKPYDPSTPSKQLFPKPTMAKQSFQAECDINNIMKKYQNTGVIEHVQKTQGAYGDFSTHTDYHDSVNRVNAANEAFLQLPSKVRKAFDNNPGNMLAFLDDPANYDEAVRLGLVKSPDIAAEGKQSKPAEPLKAVNPKGSKTPLEQGIDEEGKTDE